MDSDTIDFFASENRKRAREIDALTKGMHLLEKQVRELRSEVAALRAQPGEGDGPSIAQTRVARLRAAARYATIEVLEFLYETVIGEGGNLSALEQMDQKMVEEAVTRSVSGYIYSRWLDELGLSIEKGAISEVAAVRLEREVKEYVEACVTLELDGKSTVEIDWGGREGHGIIDRVYRDAYALLEAGS